MHRALQIFVLVYASLAGLLFKNMAKALASKRYDGLSGVDNCSIARGKSFRIVAPAVALFSALLEG